MKNILSIPVLLLAFLAIACFAYLSVLPMIADAGAFPGSQTAVATSSNPIIGTTASLVFATSTSGCTNRVVTTYASPAMMYFSDYKGQRPTGQAGHLQSASTTVSYDSSLFGCGAVYMSSFVTATITVSEFTGSR